MRGTLAKDQRGQTSVLVALSAMVLICFLAFMVNVGQVVHDRVMLQSSADMVAMSAANVQAAGLNEIADLNHEIQGLMEDLKRDLGFPWRIWASKKEALACIQYYDSWMKYARQLQHRANRTFAEGAQDIAWQVAQWHSKRYGQDGREVPGLLPGRRPLDMEPLIHPTYPGRTLAAIEPKKRQFQFAYWLPCPTGKCPPLPKWKWLGGKGAPQGYGRGRKAITETSPGIIWFGSKEIDGLNNRDGEVDTYYRVKMSRETIRPYVNLAEWGFDVAIPRMAAYSLAEPTGGNIYRCDPSYVARLMPLRTFYLFDPWRDSPPAFMQEFRH